MCKNKYCFDDTCKGECNTKQETSKKLWQCQNLSCAKVVPNPSRWAEGAKTTFACPYCKNKTLEIQGQ